ILAGCPDAVVMVAAIIHREDAGVDRRTAEYNAEIRNAQSRRDKAGQHVYLVDQYAAIVPGDDIIDGIHPSPAGYDKMAEVWRLAIQQVDSMGWISDPVPGIGG
ncbi:MAG: hypothetical protein Q9180_004832, partial [Flavoplaca navasiana]